MYTEHDAAFYLAAILDASNDAIIGQDLEGVITSLGLIRFGGRFSYAV